MGKRGPIAGARPSRQTPIFSMRLHPDLRSELEAEAEKKSRSLADEISQRLRESLDHGGKVTEAFGSEQNYMLMRMASIPLQQNKNWLQDSEQFDTCVRNIVELLERVRPGGARAVADIAGDYISNESSSLFGSSLFADALWAMVQEADEKKPRSERTRLEHFAVNAKRHLAEISKRAHPLERRRAEARRILMLSGVCPHDMNDDDLFAQEEALISDANQRYEAYLEEKNTSGAAENG